MQSGKLNDRMAIDRRTEMLNYDLIVIGFGKAETLRC